ncbi:MAG: hypothetical protein JWQ94_3431 [Tardiphaga sp.]|nr:hypothetical protein [Tardiphaga sp.]
MKKIVIIAAMATAMISAPAFAGGGGARGLVGINAGVLVGANGVLGLLGGGRGNAGVLVAANVNVGVKAGLLGSILGGGRGGSNGHGGGGCGC